MQKTWKIEEKNSEIIAIVYSSESAQRELYNEYQHDMVWMVSKIFAFLCFGRKYLKG